MTGITAIPAPLALPAEVVDVFKHFFTAELTTLGREGLPVTWPIMPIFWERRGLFVTATSIGLPQKAFNIRRDPHVPFSSRSRREAASSTRLPCWCRVKPRPRIACSPRAAILIQS